MKREYLKDSIVHLANVIRVYRGNGHANSINPNQPKRALILAGKYLDTAIDHLKTCEHETEMARNQVAAITEAIDSVKEYAK